MNTPRLNISFKSLEANKYIQWLTSSVARLRGPTAVCVRIKLATKNVGAVREPPLPGGRLVGAVREPPPGGRLSNITESRSKDRNEKPRCFARPPEASHTAAIVGVASLLVLIPLYLAFTNADVTANRARTTAATNAAATSEVALETDDVSKPMDAAGTESNPLAGNTPEPNLNQETGQEKGTSRILGPAQELPKPSSGSEPAQGPDTSRCCDVSGQGGQITMGRVLNEQGRYYQQNGDYDAAVEKFRTVIFAYPGTPEAADAYLALAETYKLNRQFKAAIENLQEFLRQFPYEPRVDRVLFFIANNYKELGEWGGATYYYEHYAARSEPLRGYAHLNIGEGYFRTGEYGKAIQSLGKALETEMARLPRIDAMEKIADSYYRLGNYQAAVEWYEKVLSLARNGTYRADITNRLGRAYASLGDVKQAKGAWGEVIENYPKTDHALKAVESLPLGSNPPTHYHQGLVYYHNDKFDAAIAAFNEYLVRHPNGEDVPRTYYYLALSYRYKGDYAEAFSRFDRIANTYAKDNLAGDSLWQSGLLAEALARCDEAIDRYGRAASSYPSSEHAEDALFRKGLCQYKLKDFDAAQGTWGALIARPALKHLGKARFWAGKAALQSGRDDAARKQLEAASGGDEGDYYANRARQLLSGTAGLSSGGSTEDLVSKANGLPEEKLAFEQWLSSWSGRPSYSYDETRLSLRVDPAFRRAEELIRVGSRDEALEEFVGLRQRYGNDPVALYEMAMFFKQNGMYYPSISTALDLANLSSVRSTQGAPKFLQKLVYPIHYGELLLTEAHRYGVDPLLLASVIRQESFFDRNAESSAEAKGLSQVMPSTGRGIARALGMSSFEEEDLFKPYVSVAFGAWYLWSQLKSFDGNTFLALAAYNAGGGSVGKWISGRQGVDDDLFVEDISYAETQTYVKQVYNQYQTYKQVYAR